MSYFGNFVLQLLESFNTFFKRRFFPVLKFKAINILHCLDCLTNLDTVSWSLKVNGIDIFFHRLYQVRNVLIRINCLWRLKSSHFIDSRSKKFRILIGHNFLYITLLCARNIVTFVQTFRISKAFKTLGIGTPFIIFVHIDYFTLFTFNQYVSVDSELERMHCPVINLDMTLRCSSLKLIDSAMALQSSSATIL